MCAPNWSFRVLPRLFGFSDGKEKEQLRLLVEVAHKTLTLGHSSLGLSGVCSCDCAQTANAKMTANTQSARRHMLVL
jgi:hypothetical protein